MNSERWRGGVRRSGRGRGGRVAPPRRAAVAQAGGAHDAARARGGRLRQAPARLPLLASGRPAYTNKGISYLFRY